MKLRRVVCSAVERESGVLKVGAPTISVFTPLSAAGVSVLTPTKLLPGNAATIADRRSSVAGPSTVLEVPARVLLNPPMTMAAPSLEAPITAAHEKRARSFIAGKRLVIDAASASERLLISG